VNAPLRAAAGYGCDRGAIGEGLLGSVRARRHAAIGTVIIAVRKGFDTRCITRGVVCIAHNNPRCVVQPVPQ